MISSGSSDSRRPQAYEAPLEADSAAAIPSKAPTKLLFVTPEMGDYIKAGGLGEVSSALPRALRASCDVRVLIPAYRQVRLRHQNIEVVRQMPRTAALPPWSLGRFHTSDGLIIYAVLCDELFDRLGSPYGEFSGRDFPDNDLRFARLSLAAAEICAGEADPNWRPDVVHLNDWPSALTAGYLAWKNIRTPSLLTIHNLAYQGLFEPSRLQDLAIPSYAFGINGAEFHGKLSFLKSGVFYASHLTTVSETYSREITTPEHGCGLEGLLLTRMNEGRLTGIVNGIDESWTAPGEGEKDGARIFREWKKKNAREVRLAYGLSASSGPLFSIISRLVHQKGIDLSIGSARTILENDGQLVAIGRGEARLESALQDLARQHKGRVAARIGFDDQEARGLFAGSDFLLMPSRFEPCGLSQMYAQRFGALPIAYRTGGLVDTIEDGKSGFLFSQLSGDGLSGAVMRAMDAFKAKAPFRTMRRYAITRPFQWANSARRYASVYAAMAG
ncbi:glycogen synthase GlgA [Terrarubrum flagellatum]|uniref:glycogen synthase GlgA n=1 Tax=Terrirubrum flagellatum TaxID=2895980 RepID=UPI003144E263